MQVDIIDKSENWLDTIWTAIRTCHSEKIPLELKIGAVNQPEDGKIKLVLSCAKLGHLSVLEHATVTFAVSWVSRSLLAQYSRHRIGISLSVQSQRYVSKSPLDFVTPGKLCRRSDMQEAFMHAMRTSQEVYERLIMLGAPKEDARAVLPNATCTNFVTTLNLRSLLDLYNKRVRVAGAQAEIKEMVQTMADRVIEVEPWTAGLFTAKN